MFQKAVKGKEKGRERRKSGGRERGEREEEMKKTNTFIVLTSGIYEPRINQNKELQRDKDI